VLPWLAALGAVAWAAGASVVWGQHPLLMAWMAVGALGIWGLAFWRPAWALACLLCVLPVANLSMWTGWRHLAEMDLLVLLMASGMWARLAWSGWPLGSLGRSPGATRSIEGAKALGLSLRPILWAWGPWVLISLLALGRAYVDTPDHPLDLRWGGDTAWSNSLGLIRPLIWLGCLLPGVWLARRMSPQWSATLAWGMVGGVLVVCAILLWERSAYAGLLNLSSNYRTTAWFWEMRVGGGALDAYLALAAPFAWWLLFRSRTWLQWGAATMLLAAVVYGVVTTFSRGVLVASVLGSVLMCWLVGGRRPMRSVAGGVLAYRVLIGLLALETLVLVIAGNFAVERLHSSARDAVSRWHHWQSSFSLAPDQTTRWLGLGLGRLPAHYSSRVPGGGFPGQLVLNGSSVQLLGPATPTEPGDKLSMVQRVVWSWQAAQQIRLQVRAYAPVVIRVATCERHLLYAVQCRWAEQKIAAQAGIQRLEVPLTHFETPEAGVSGYSGRRADTLELSVHTVGGRIEVHGLGAMGPSGVLPVQNAEFRQGLAHWSAVADGHFLPWHTDSLYLELLIERGLIGLGAFFWLCAGCIRALRQGHLASPDVMALQVAIGSLLLLGLLISVMEFTRVAFLLQFMLLWAFLLGDVRPNASS
jgi:hypothetical protein